MVLIHRGVNKILTLKSKQVFHSENKTLFVILHFHCIRRYWNLEQTNNKFIPITTLYLNKKDLHIYLSSTYVNFIPILCRERNVLPSNGVSIFDGWGIGRAITAIHFTAGPVLDICRFNNRLFSWAYPLHFITWKIKSRQIIHFFSTKAYVNIVSCFYFKMEFSWRELITKQHILGQFLPPSAGLRGRPILIWGGGAEMPFEFFLGPDQFVWTAWVLLGGWNCPG